LFMRGLTNNLDFPFDNQAASGQAPIMATEAEMVEIVESLIDDCAAIGRADAALALSEGLSKLAAAAAARAQAINHRLAGRIRDAIACEQRSGNAVTDARYLLPERR
jgi:hypothetical protein